jgi:hypothetical protein
MLNLHKTITIRVLLQVFRLVEIIINSYLKHQQELLSKLMLTWKLLYLIRASKSILELIISVLITLSRLILFIIRLLIKISSKFHLKEETLEDNLMLRKRMNSERIILTLVFQVKVWWVNQLLIHFSVVLKMLQQQEDLTCIITLRLLNITVLNLMDHRSLMVPTLFQTVKWHLNGYNPNLLASDIIYDTLYLSTSKQ